MKKYLLLFLSLWWVFTTYSFANWDSLVLGSIDYDTTTCTLKIARSIWGHHTDIYQYKVRWPVIVNIPNQTANIAWEFYANVSGITWIEYAVPTCNETCSMGTTPLSWPVSDISAWITAFSVLWSWGGVAYTLSIVEMNKNIYVIRKTAIETCLRCQEGKYWCPSANTCINKGATCSDHQCNTDTICDINEWCGCSDCATQQDHCAAGLSCTYDTTNNNNSSCDKIRCWVGTYFCPVTQICLTKGTTCSNHQCLVDGICAVNEGCGCADCNEQQDHCADTLICTYDATNHNNSECISTECSDGNYWCSVTHACVANTVPCGGTCKSPLILHNGVCIANWSCLPGNLCCPTGTYFCSPQSTCKAAGQACGI